MKSSTHQPDPTPARPSAGRPAPPTRAATAVTSFASKLVIGIARHWLAIFNIAWGAYVFLPFLAPILMAVGWNGPARLIYGVYSFACHQLPDHSYFLFGPNLAPSLSVLESNGLEAGTNIFLQRRFIGNEALGFKVAICQRDVAIYGSVLLGGLLYALARKRTRPLDWRLYLLFLIPIAVDGTTQLFGLRESNWWLRSLTGALFGTASVWLAYPYVDGAMQDVLEDELAPSTRSDTVTATE